MVRASLPCAGVAAVLLVASAAVGQTPSPFDEYVSPFILPVTAEVIWEQPAETPPPLELVEDGLTMSIEAAPPPKDSKRIKPTPQKDGQTKEPPSTECPEGDCGVVLENFPTFCCLPFASPYPPQQQGCSGHKSHRRNRGGRQNNNCGGYGNGWGNPYLAWPYGPSGCPGFCAPPPQQNCGGRRCHRNRGGGNGGGCDNGGGYGYGYGGYGGYPGAWGGFGWDGGFGCDGFCGYYPPPTQQGCGCRRCQRKHRSGGQNCPRCGYPNGGGYGNAWAFPVPGWSTPYDGINSFTDPNCLGGGCGGKHGHGRSRRGHGCNQQAPQPSPYWGMAQPCFMDGDFPF